MPAGRASLFLLCGQSLVPFADVGCSEPRQPFFSERVIHVVLVPAHIVFPAALVGFGELLQPQVEQGREGHFLADGTLLLGRVDAFGKIKFDEKSMLTH